METTPELDPSELTFHLLATGLTFLYQAEGTLSYPYPAPLQRAFNRVFLDCLGHQIEPPTSMADMLNACYRPLLETPFFQFLPDSVLETGSCLIDADEL